MEFNNSIRTLKDYKEINKTKKGIETSHFEGSDANSFEKILNGTIKEKKHLSKGNYSYKASDLSNIMAERENYIISRGLTQDKIDGAVGKVANFFGISGKFMRMILESLGIKPEDLLDPSKREAIIKALGKHFNLSDSKEAELSKLMNKFL